MTHGRQAEYVNLREMAAQTGFSRSVIAAAIQRGELPSLRLGKGKNGGTIWVRREAFEQWLSERETKGSPDGSTR
jgi:excisionase family DNA binding protein